MKTILYPTEFSERSPVEFCYAAELAYFLKARLLMLHVLYRPGLSPATVDQQQSVANDILERMSAFAEQNLPADYSGIVIHYSVRAGNVADTIMDTILAEGADLVVMGTSSMAKAYQSILGSTALAILRKAGCPVLAIPAKAKYEGVDNLVYTTNFGFRDLGAILYLKKWSKAFDAPLHCVHIMEQDGDECSVSRNMGVLESLFARHKNLYFDLKRGNFRQQTERFARQKRADIIAMSSHRGGLLSGLLDRNQATHLMDRVQIPLLVIREGAWLHPGSTTKWLDRVKKEESLDTSTH